MTTGPGKFAVARRLLEGDALTAFENAATAEGVTETLDNCQKCLNKVASHVFPPTAAQMQKHFLRRVVRKPASMKIREYAARIQELNNYLPSFPPGPGATRAVTKLEEDELVELMHSGVPRAWRRFMMLHDFSTMTATVQEFIAFCERMERVEAEEGKSLGKTAKAENKGKEKEKEKEKKPNTKKRQNDNSKGQYCLLHGKCGHGTNDCRTMTQQAKRMKATYEAQTPEEKKRLKSRQELNALVAEQVERALQNQKKKSASNKKKRELQAIEDAEISDDSHSVTSINSDD